MSVSDSQLISNLVLEYADLFDAGRWEEAAALFTDAVVHTSDGESTSSQLLALWRRMVIRYDDGTPKTSHLTTNLRIEVDGETATCRSSYSVLQATESLPMQVICSGRYSDIFTRVDGTWRFASRAYAMDLRGDLSQHLR